MDLKGKVCETDVWEGFHYHQCRKPAKIEVDGHYYCGLHDPIRRKVKDDERYKKYQERLGKEREAWRRKDLMERILCNKTTEELEQMAKDSGV